MTTAKLTAPSLTFSKAPTVLEIKGQGTLTILKSSLVWRPYAGKTNVRKYNWAQLAAHLGDGGRAVKVD